MPFYLPTCVPDKYFFGRESFLGSLLERVKRKPKLAAVPLSGDFITDYVTYADVLEAPSQAHEAVAISLLAAVLNPNIEIRYGALFVSVDLWVLLLSSSGMGRNTLVDLARPVLREAALDGLLRTNTWGSRESLYEDLSRTPNGLFLWPELSVVLKSFSGARFRGAKEWFTDRYDNMGVPDTVRYRQKGMGMDTPSIVFTQAPRINLLATSSHAWFVSNLDQDDSSGGFVPRWMMVKLEGPSRLIPKPRETDQRLIAPLGEHLRRAHELKGPADLSKVEDLYGEWYRQTKHRFLAEPNQALASAFFNRLRTHVLKLAVVFEVSRSISLSVSSEAMKRAIEFAKSIEQTIFSLLPTGMSREGAEVDKIAERIRASGAEGLPMSELTRAFQHIKAHDRHYRIQTLLQARTVCLFGRQTAGRTAKIIVHKDFVDDYRIQFAEDSEVTLGK